MKSKQYIYILALISAVLTSCSVETPFQGEVRDGQGQLSKTAFAIEVSGAEITTKAGNNINLDDFNIVIQTVGNSPTTIYSKKYGETPDVIPLEAGSYKMTATYGENLEAEFENLHYLGTSQEFVVKKNEITSDIGKIKCYLNNVKVSIKFHPTLVQHMDNNSYVDVKINDGKALTYTLEHSDNEIAGYFRHDEECTLVATFHGKVDGIELTETKTLKDVSKGNHYKITFVRHEYNNEESGEVNGSVTVDASVTVQEIDRDITIQDDEILDDKERPKEDNGNGKDDPNQDPDNPDIPDDSNKSIPQIQAQDPIDLDIVNEVNGTSTVVLIFTSQIGFTKFEADIVSNDLTDEELQQIGLAAHLDLINPGDLKDPLQGLGLLKNEAGEDVDSVLGQKVVKFDISNFMVPLSVFSGEHHFIIRVGDDNGENECTLKLKI